MTQLQSNCDSKMTLVLFSFKRKEAVSLNGYINLFYRFSIRFSPKKKGDVFDDMNEVNQFTTRNIFLTTVFTFLNSTNNKKYIEGFHCN